MTADPVMVVSEDRILALFWEWSGRPGIDRLWLLSEMSLVEIQRPADWDRELVRARSLTAKRNVRIDKCFACFNADRQIHWHHVVWVSHGGSEALANQVPICRRCHAVLHPWLEPDGPRYSTWVAVSDIAERMKSTMAPAHARKS